MMAQMIALDWGTTRIRAALLGADGSVQEERFGDSRVGSASPDEFAEDFARLTEGWVADLAVACGMVGSRQGWHEAPYIACPADLGELGNHVCSISAGGVAVHIVPGLQVQRPKGSYDVMRGEETQIAGLVARLPGFSGTAVLPGTHSKWVKLREGVVIDFLSFMTGELFDTISSQTILRHSMPKQNNDSDIERFRSALVTAKEMQGAIWSEFFSIRANALVAGDGDGFERDHLSGLLIGAEFSTALREGFEMDQVAIIGGGNLIGLYEAAADTFGMKSETYLGTDLVWPALYAIGQSIIKEGR